MYTLDKSRSLRINGKNVYLRPITLADVSERYVQWMNDPDVTDFLESRFMTQNHNSVAAFVKSMYDSKDNILFAICEQLEDKHVGNIRLGPVNNQHHRAELGIIIGDKSCWGKGYASEAIALIIRYGFETLKLNKLTSGAYACNIGSIKAFQKNGFLIEGTLRDHSLCKETFVDYIKMGLINKSFKHEE